MWLAHIVQRDAVLRVVDDDLVPAVAVYGLLQAEVEVGILTVVAEHRVEVFDDADIPSSKVKEGRKGLKRFDGPGAG